MRFVFVSYNYDPGYTDPHKWLTRIKGYLGVLTSLSRAHEVIRIKQMGYEGEELFEGVNFKFVNYKDAALRFPFKLHRLIKSLQPDVVVVHGLHNPLQVLQLRFYVGKKTRIIAQNHAEKPGLGFKKIMQRLADRYINAYLFASRQMGLDWVNKGNLASVAKIHEVMETSSVFYPMDKSEARRRTGAQGDQIFLWVGRLDANKDPITVAKVFLRYVSNNPGARLYMIYHTEELLPILKAFLNNAPNAAAVVLVGKVPNADLQYWYNSADVFVAASYYEGSGTAVCEAMSCGCVPVVTDIFSFRMITDNGKIGLLYPAGNEAKLLSALTRLNELDMQAEREKALAYYALHLSFNAIAKKIWAIAEAL